MRRNRNKEEHRLHFSHAFIMPAATPTYATCEACWGSFQAAWTKEDHEGVASHFAETGTFTLYDQTAQKADVYTGRKEIAGFFERWIKKLKGEVGMKPRFYRCVENSEQGPGSIMFCWEAPGAGIQCASKSIIFNTNNEIHRKEVTVVTDAGFAY